jgi:Ni,Fe-hydrogenase maturation factor
MKILVLGNEFIEGDSFAKKVGGLLEKDFDVVAIKDSFQLMGIFEEKEEFILLDVVQGLEKVCFVRPEDLREDAIMSAHDFDVGYVLKLLEKDVRIVGIPMGGDLEGVAGEVVSLIESI